MSNTEFPTFIHLTEAFERGEVGYPLIAEPATKMNVIREKHKIINFGCLKQFSCWFFLFFVFLPQLACQGNQKDASSGPTEPTQTGTVEPAGGNDVFRVGQEVPSISLPNLAGKPFELKSLAGKRVLLNFWATWCVPCVAEMPALERLYKTLKDKNFEIVAVNVDASENDPAVKKFISDTGLSFTILRDTEFAVPPRFGLTGFPESFLIDQNGKFVEFQDPITGNKSLRVVGDRPWDSKAMIKAVQDFLDREK